MGDHFNLVICSSRLKFAETSAPSATATLEMEEEGPVEVELATMEASPSAASWDKRFPVLMVRPIAACRASPARSTDVLEVEVATATAAGARVEVEAAKELAEAAAAAEEGA